MLCAKCNNFGPCCFRKEDSYSFFSVYFYVKMWALGRGPFWLQGNYLNYFGRGSLGDTQCKSSRTCALIQEDFKRFFFQINDPLVVASFDHRDITSTIF